MTIAVSVKVGEGLVMAADSTSSFFIEDVLAQSYHHARKLLQLADYPVGILTYGLGNIAGRNLESLVAEFEQRLVPYASGTPYTVHEVAQNLYQFILTKYEATFPPPALLPLGANPEAEHGAEARQPALPDAPGPEPEMPSEARPALGVVVGGYSRDDFFPDQFEFLIPFGPPTEIWPDPLENRQQFGVRWWGQTAPIQRLYLGCDLRAVDWFRENGVSEEDAFDYYRQLRDRLMWPIIYEGMPIQDAIDLAVYLVNVTIGHSRFAVGPPVCGGHIDVATITSRGFRWIRRKEWIVKTDSVFF